jgi:hypothetical protein
MESQITVGNFSLAAHLPGEKRELDSYYGKSMMEYVAWAPNIPDAITIGMAPDGDPVYLERSNRDAMFYGQAGARALMDVVSGELLRMQQLSEQRMIIMTTSPRKWQGIIESTLGRTKQVHVFDVKNSEDAQRAAQIVRKPNTDSERVASLSFTFVFDQVDSLGKSQEIGRAIESRAWRDYGNVTVLGSLADARGFEGYGDFVSIVPVTDDNQEEVFGVMYQPVNMPRDIHLVRIFS